MTGLVASEVYDRLEEVLNDISHLEINIHQSIDKIFDELWTQVHSREHWKDGEPVETDYGTWLLTDTPVAEYECMDCQMEALAGKRPRAGGQR